MDNNLPDLPEDDPLFPKEVVKTEVVKKKATIKQKSRNQGIKESRIREFKEETIQSRIQGSKNEVPRRIKVKSNFEVFQDQLISIEELKFEGKKRGVKITGYQVVTEALDEYLPKLKKQLES